MFLCQLFKVAQVMGRSPCGILLLAAGDFSAGCLAQPHLCLDQRSGMQEAHTRPAWVAAAPRSRVGAGPRAAPFPASPWRLQADVQRPPRSEKQLSEVDAAAQPFTAACGDGSHCPVSVPALPLPGHLPGPVHLLFLHLGNLSKNQSNPPSRVLLRSK